jgi:uncharacterized OB-fold protein
VPVPDAGSAPFWAATARRTLALARCARCLAFAHPPDVVCPNCGSSEPDFSFEEVSGAGRVLSWTVMRQSFLPGFEQDVPFVLVDVELDPPAGVRLIGRLLDGPDTPLQLGDRVQLGFEDVSEFAVPAFSLVAARET